VKRLLAISGIAAAVLNARPVAWAQDAAQPPVTIEAPSEDVPKRDAPEEEIETPWRLALTQFSGIEAEEGEEGDGAAPAMPPLKLEAGAPGFSQGVMYDPAAVLLVSWAGAGAWPGGDIRSSRGPYSAGVAYPALDYLVVAFAEAAGRQSPGARRWLAALGAAGGMPEPSGAFLGGRLGAGSPGVMYAPGWAAFSTATEALRWWRAIHGPSAGGAFLVLESGFGFTSEPDPTTVEAYLWRRYRAF
jgi:hypothetical protein